MRLDSYPTKGHRGLLHQNVDPQQPQGSHLKSEGGVKPVRANSHWVMDWVMVDWVMVDWVMVDWVMVDGALLLCGMVHRAVGVEGARAL